MTFDLRSQIKQQTSVAKAKLQAVQAAVLVSMQSSFRALKLRLSVFTKLSPQSTLLKLLAVAAATLMVVLAIGGLQTIAQGTWSDEPAGLSPVQPPAASVAGWAGLPTGPANTATDTVIEKTAAEKTAAEKTATEKTAAAPSSGRPHPAGFPAPGKSATKTSIPKPTSPVPSAVLTQSSLMAIAPQQEVAPADPTNYGDRYTQDVSGNPIQNQPLIVLHETVGSADSAINTFYTPHTNENDQSSYHSIIRLNGTIVYIVPPEKRAFGAGNSVFNGANGKEAVQTHRQFPPSVNNFAYHISLETPPDGANNAPIHSGYTDAQYRSLAWLVAHTDVPDQRITTHQAIDQSGSRSDPRSFDTQKFFLYLHSLPRPALEQ